MSKEHHSMEHPGGQAEASSNETGNDLANPSQMPADLSGLGTLALQAAYEAAPIGLCVLDHELRYLHINATLADANSVSASDHIGRRITDILPAFRGDLEMKLRRVLAGEEFRGMEISGPHGAQGGEIATFCVNWLPLRTGSGAVHGIAISAEDVTIQQSASRALAEREALLAAVGASSPDLIYAKDTEGRILYANPATLAALGQPMEKVQGRTSLQVLGDNGGAEVMANDLKVMRTGLTSAFDEHLSDPKGTPRVYQSTKAPLRETGGTVIGMVGISRDVTDHRNAELRAAFLHRLSDRLRDDPRALKVTGEEVGRFFGVTRAGYTVADRVGNSLTVGEDWTDGSVGRVVGHHDMQAFGSWIMDLLASGAPLVVEDALSDPRVTDPTAYLALSIRSVMMAPVLREGVLVATVFLNHNQPRKWSRDEVELLEEVARRTWAAVAREQAQDALKFAEMRHRTVLSATASVVWSTSEEGLFVVPQPSWADYTGQAWPDHAGISWLEMVHPDDRAHLMADWQTALASGGNHASEARLWQHKTGTWRRCLTSAGAIRNDAGQIVEWVGAITDIDVQRRAESDLRDSEQRLRIAQEAAGLGIFELDLDAGTVLADRRTCKIFGLPPDGPHPLEPVLAQICPDYRDRIVKELQAAHISGGRTLSVECRILPRGSQDVIWISLSGRATEGRDAPRRIIGSVRDVTARRRADDTLHALNTDLEARVLHAVNERNRLWSLTDDLLITVDTTGQIHEVSQSWTRVLGWDPATLVENTYADLIHPDDQADFAVHIAALRGGGQSASFEDRIRAADGSWRKISWRVSVEPDTGRLYCIGRDVSAERAQAEALALAEAHLHEAQKLETIGQLTGGVAHDFNNLLAAINANLEIARKRNSDNSIAPMLESALRAAERGATLTGRLLAFARRQELRAETVRPVTLVEGMIDLLSRSIGPEVELQRDLPDDLGHIHVDVNQLELAILNLAVNARDAMPEGGTLTITGRNTHVDDSNKAGLPPGDFVVLSVSDTGLGMDEATRRRASEPFFTTKGPGKGTGLGLSMVHGLTAQSGGEMQLFSTLGAGTTVEIWLPAAGQVTVNAAPAHTEDTTRSVKPGDEMSPGRVLVVDDDVLVAMGTTIMLEDMGYEVVTAYSAAEALQVFADDGPFCLVVTDHAMPGMSGLALAERLISEVPVIMATGYADLQHDGPSTFPRLAKPFGQAELARVIAQAFAE